MARNVGLGSDAATSFDDALGIIQAGASPLGAERIAYTQAGGRVLAVPVVARIDAPRHRVAAMDGYAIRRNDADAGIVNYRLQGANLAGHTATGSVAPAGAVYVATGAVVPNDAGRIVPWELVSADTKVIALCAPLPAKLHIREAKSDFAAGEFVVPAGRKIDYRTMVAIAAADVDEVEVWRRPRVCILVTGDELVAPGRAAASLRSIPDSLGAALSLFVRQWGGEAVDVSLVPDDAHAISAAAHAAINRADIVLVTGGASRGLRDMSKAAMARLGIDLGFRRVAMRPGGPSWFGRTAGVHIVGLPGNPTAAITVARLLVAPLLERLCGHKTGRSSSWEDRLASAAIPANGAREAFLCGVSNGTGVELTARDVASDQMMLASADVLIRRAANAPAVDCGAAISTLRL